jgi:glyoxylase-like metal-dependent hydrolase (beta-lactamase superfamily II)
MAPPLAERRTLLRALAGAVALGSTGIGRAQHMAEFEPVTVPIKPIRVSERVYVVQGDVTPVSTTNQGFNANAGFVLTRDGVVVFDALGTPALGAALLDQIRRLTDQPVRRVVVSHYHADHFYGLQAFKSAGAQVWAHRLVNDYLKTEAPVLRLAERRESLFPWVNEHTRIIAPDVTIDRETSFELGGIRFRLIPVGPAHTPEDLMMLVEDEKVLFAGDLVFAGRVPFVGDADSRAWLAALDRMAAQPPSTIVTGHGPYSRDGKADLDMTREYLRLLRTEMAKAVDEMLEFNEAYARVDWSRFTSLPAFEAANRRNAFNTFVLMEREALSSK